MNNYIDEVNIFFGTDKYNYDYNQGLAKTWFAYKPKVGNLSPACCMPYSAFTVVPYSGGYPCGYGKYVSSSDAVPASFTKTNTIKGFTHFCQSGVGYIDNFYNYFLISPFKKQKIISESGKAGSYSVKTKKYDADVVVSDNYASYIITFKNGKNALKVYPAFSGLCYPLGLKPKNNECECKIDKNLLTASVNYGTVKIYYALKVNNNGTFKAIKDGYVFDCKERRLALTLAYSFVGTDDALNGLKKSKQFKDTLKSTESVWNALLGKVEFVGNNKNMFYTALYNSVKKPCVTQGFIDGVVDYSTLWDIYKTSLPLTMLLNDDVSSKLVNGLSGVFDGQKFFCSRLMEATPVVKCDGQASCLAGMVIATAYRYGINADYEKLFKMAESDIKWRLANEVPLTRVTHNIDLSDAICAYVDLGRDIGVGKEKVGEILKPLFDSQGVYLLENNGSRYYEGCNSTYSFRASASTIERLKFTNLNAFKREADRFFGFGQSVVRSFEKPVRFLHNKIRNYGDKVKRFCGLNNETDMDSPFIYHFIGEYDRCGEVVKAIKSKFICSRDGLCGNDDSGGLTSWYVFACLGMFPVAGTDRILLYPSEKFNAVLHLKNGDLKVKTYKGEIPVYNDVDLTEWEIDISKLKNGGELLIPEI